MKKKPINKQKIIYHIKQAPPLEEMDPSHIGQQYSSLGKEDKHRGPVRGYTHIFGNCITAVAPYEVSARYGPSSATENDRQFAPEYPLKLKMKAPRAFCFA